MRMPRLILLKFKILDVIHEVKIHFNQMKTFFFKFINDLHAPFSPQVKNDFVPSC